MICKAFIINFTISTSNLSAHVTHEQSHIYFLVSYIN